MKTLDGMSVGIAGLLFILVALFTPIGAVFLVVIGIVAFITLKYTQPKQ